MDANANKIEVGIMARWSSVAPYFLAALRVVAAIMFIQSGTVKLFSWPMPMPEGVPPIELFSQVGIGAVLELVGGVLMLLGLFTRPVAFILAGEMAVAYWQFHFNAAAPWPMLNGGTDAVLYCFIWLYYSAAGAGPLSIDALINKR